MATMNPQRYVLVTGGSGGIGSALCSALAKIDIKKGLEKNNALAIAKLIKVNDI